MVLNIEFMDTLQVTGNMWGSISLAAYRLASSHEAHDSSYGNALILDIGAKSMHLV